MVEYVTKKELQDVEQRVAPLVSRVQKLLDRSDVKALVEELLNFALNYRKDARSTLDYLAFQVYLSKHPEFRKKLISQLIELVLRTALERKIKNPRDAEKFINGLFQYSMNYYRSNDEFSLDVAWSYTKHHLLMTDFWFIARYRELEKVLPLLLGLSLAEPRTAVMQRILERLKNDTKAELAFISRALHSLLNLVDNHKEIKEVLDYISTLQSFVDNSTADLSSILYLLYSRNALAIKLIDLSKSLNQQDIYSWTYSLLDSSMKILAENYKYLDLLTTLPTSEMAKRIDSEMKKLFGHLFRKRLKDLGISSRERFYLQFYRLEKILNKDLDSLTYRELYEPLFLEFLGLEKSWLESLIKLRF